MSKGLDHILLDSLEVALVPSC